MIIPVVKDIMAYGKRLKSINIDEFVDQFIYEYEGDVYSIVMSHGVVKTVSIIFGSIYYEGGEE